jgi:hypothetical protein
MKKIMALMILTTLSFSTMASVTSEGGYGEEVKPDCNKLVPTQAAIKADPIINSDDEKPAEKPATEGATV